jgi:3-oxoadipate enol-lactonase
MRLQLNGRNIAFDLVGADNAPVVCMTHSLASDGGMWAEQVPPLLAGGFRVLRIDMRGHGGSDPVAGEYTMNQLAGDVVGVLEQLGLARVHYVGLSIGGMLGQALAIEHPGKVISAMWCDTLPASPAGAAQAWADRMRTVRAANSLAPLAVPTMERWFTDAFKPRNPGRWQEIHDTIIGTSPAGYLGCSAGIQNFDFTAKLPTLKLPVLVVVGDGDAGTPPVGNKLLADLVPGAGYAEIKDARHFPNVEHPNSFNRLMMSWLWTQRGLA